MREYNVLCEGCSNIFKVSGSVKIGAQMTHICGFEGIISLSTNKNHSLRLVKLG